MPNRVPVVFEGGFYDNSGVIALDPEADGRPPLQLSGGRDVYSRRHQDQAGTWIYRLTDAS